MTTLCAPFVFSHRASPTPSSKDRRWAAKRAKPKLAKRQKKRRLLKEKRRAVVSYAARRARRCLPVKFKCLLQAIKVSARPDSNRIASATTRKPARARLSPERTAVHLTAKSRSRRPNRKRARRQSAQRAKRSFISTSASAALWTGISRRAALYYASLKFGV